MKPMTRKAIVLLSGGLDSTTCLAIAQNEGFDVYALSILYGQRHDIEMRAAERIAREYGVKEHRSISIDLRLFGGSALTDDVDVPKHKDVSEIGTNIPVTYVPARNTVFLSYGVAWAEVVGAQAIYIGVNALDYSGYPDCRPEFIEAFERMAKLATKAGVEGNPVRIFAPLINMTKADIIRTGARLGVDYGMTHSCYDPAEDGRACGECDSCLLRKKGFEQAGVPDPTIYA